MIYSTFGNAIDALCYCLGELTELNATAINRRKTTTIIETGKSISMTAYDQIAVTGLLENGGVVSAHYRGGMFKGANFYWEINGTKGDLVVTAAGGHPAVFDLTIQGSQDGDEGLKTLAVPETYEVVKRDTITGPAYNVAANYARLASDLNNGTHLAASFNDALIRHRMLNAIEIAAQTGERQHYLASPLKAGHYITL